MPQLLHLAHERGVLGRLVEDDAQLVDVERLGDVVESTELHGADRRLHGLGSRQHDDRHARIAAPHLLEQLEAVHARHDDVEEDDVERPGRERLQRVGARRDRDRVVGVLQDHAQRLAHPGLVVDDEDPSLDLVHLHPPLLESLHRRDR